jgi:hypothetical protein
MTATESAGAIGAIPAAEVITACLRAQAGVPRRSRAARVFGRSPLSEDSRPWYLGALGEVQVAERLAKLGPDWTVLHSVPIGERGSDIDHVVLGPAEFSRSTRSSTSTPASGSEVRGYLSTDRSPTICATPATRRNGSPRS